MAAGGPEKDLIGDVYAEDIRAIERARSFLEDFNLDTLLPQICVVGDQSAGKSSVLEALTGVPFPSGDDTVTTTPAVVRVGPAGEEKRFHIYVGEKVVKTDEKEEATKAILDAQEAILSEAGGVSFSKKAVTVDVFTDDLPPLVLVDLPGIVRCEGAGKTTVLEMVKDRIKGENVLILLVSEASQEAEMDEAGEVARRSDKDEMRTLRVFTKCDRAAKDLALKRKVVDCFAAAQEKYEGGDLLAPHFVTVRDDTGSLRNKESETEALAFLHADSDALVGAASLSKRLATHLSARIKPSIPKLLESLKKEIDGVSMSLAKIGIRPRERGDIITGAKRRLLDVVSSWWVDASIKLEKLAEDIRCSRRTLFLPGDSDDEDDGEEKEEEERGSAGGGGGGGGGSDKEVGEVKAIQTKIKLRADIAPEFQGQDVVDEFIAQSVKSWGEKTEALLLELASALEEQMTKEAVMKEDPETFQREVKIAIEIEMEQVKKVVVEALDALVKSMKRYGTFNHYHSASVIDQERAHDTVTEKAIKRAMVSIGALITNIPRTKLAIGEEFPPRHVDFVKAKDIVSPASIEGVIRHAFAAEVARAKRKSHRAYQAAKVHHITIATHKVKSKDFPDQVLAIARDSIFFHFHRWTEDLLDCEPLRASAKEDPKVTSRRKYLCTKEKTVKKVAHDLKKRFG